MSKLLIIDDSDPAIVYMGNWATLTGVGATTGEYNSTVHQSGVAGDQLSYTFEGTGITVFGTLDEPGAYGSPRPSFSIDGQTPTGFDSNPLVGLSYSILSYVPLFRSSELTKGTHTLVVSTGTSASTAARLYVDFLLVETGESSASGNIVVDDRDALIAYVGNWQNGGSTWEFNLTATAAPSDVAGGTATFHFNGTSLTIYGTTPSSSGANTTAAITFAVDGGTNTRFDSPQNAQVIQHNTLFHVEGLSNTQEHSVVMTSLNTNRWSLDFIVYNTQNSAIAGGGAGGGSSSRVGSGGTGGGGGGGGGPSVGVVIGGVVAGIVAGMVIAGIIFLLIRRRKLKSEEEPNMKNVTVRIRSHFDSSLHPSPFTPPVVGQNGHANPSPNKRHDPNINNGGRSALTSGAGERVVPAVTTTVVHPPPSGVRTAEGESGTGIPASSPPVYTPEQPPEI